jgi:hypothetical protein
MTTRTSEHRATVPRAKGSSASGAGHGREPLQIRIPTAVKRRFKAHAALRGLEPHQLFVEVWDHYEATHAVPSQGNARV